MTNSVGQCLFGQRRIWFDDTPLRMSPFRLNGVEPGTLDREKTDEQADTVPRPLDGAIVVTKPSADDGAGVPAGIIPNQDQNRLAKGGDLLTSPSQELNGDGTHGTTLDKAQEHFFADGLLGWPPAQQHPIAGQCFGVSIAG